MAHDLHQSSSLKCELKILKAKNLEFVPSGDVFVRYYLIDGDGDGGVGSRIKLNSREIGSTCEPVWNEQVTLECQVVAADHSSISTFGGLRRQSVAFELRWRSAVPVIGRIGRSKLLARAEMAWKEVLESTDMSVEKWVPLKICSGGGVVGLKPPALRIGMKVAGAVEEKRRAGGSNSNRSWKECSCRHCAYGRDEEIYAIAAALEVVI